MTVDPWTLAQIAKGAIRTTPLIIKQRNVAAKLKASNPRPVYNMPDLNEGEK